MLDINLLPEERRAAAAAPSRTGRTAALLALFIFLVGLAAVAFLNLHYTYSVIPALERQIATRETMLATHAAAEAKLADAEALLAERVRRVDTTKALFAGHSARAEVLAAIQAAVNRADASLRAGAGTVWLRSIDILGEGMVLDGFVAGPADAPVGEAVEALAQELGGTMELLEPQDDSPPQGYAGVWRFFVRADLH